MSDPKKAPPVIEDFTTMELFLISYWSKKFGTKPGEISNNTLLADSIRAKILKRKGF